MGKRSNFERKPRDFYPTPPEAVAPLIPHLNFGDMFCEPCAGDLALVRALEAEGLSCANAMDVAPRAPGVVQLDALTDDLDCYIDNCEWIITNPPWSRDVLHPMIEHFSRLAPTWLLFDADWMHTKQSAPFMPMLRKVVSDGRLRWIPGSKMTGKDNCAWYLFDRHGAGETVFVGRSA